MARRLFGTDGIRGTANTEPMTPETALKVAMAVGESLHNGAHKHLVVIGKDTRLSGYMLEPALTAGFITMGMDVVLVGPLPTPAIAMLTRSLRADIGVVISASHNPYASSIAHTAPPTRSPRRCSGNWAPRCSRSACPRTGSTSTANAAR